MISFNNNKRIDCIWSIIILLIFNLFCWRDIHCEQQHDFQFDVSTDEDLQVVFTEPIDVVDNSYRKNQTETTTNLQNEFECPFTDKKIILSLVLRTNNWDDIVYTKRNRAIKKLTNFFAIPKELASSENVYQRNIYEMSKHTLRKGVNNLDKNFKKLGQIAFTIGCGNKYFPTGQLVANQIAQQINDGTINDISGLDFGWWLIWQKHVIHRTPRNKRDALSEKEGSGEEDDYYYDDNDDEEGTVDITEVPVINKVIDEHPHRHHHGDENLNTVRNNFPNLEQIDRKTATKTAAIAPVNIDMDIQESVSKLESDISKTIENNNNKLKEVQAEIEKLKYKKTKFDELPAVETIIDTNLDNGNDDDDDDENDDEDDDIDDEDDLISTIDEVTQLIPIVDYSDNKSKGATSSIVEKTTISTPTTTSLVDIIPREYDLNTITTIIASSSIDPMVLVTKISTTPKSEIDEMPTTATATPTTTTVEIFPTTTPSVITSTSTTTTSTITTSTTTPTEDVKNNIISTTTTTLPTTPLITDISSTSISTEENILFTVTQRKIENTLSNQLSEKPTQLPDGTTPLIKVTTPLMPTTDDYDETDYDDYEDEFKSITKTTITRTPQTTPVKVTEPPPSNATTEKLLTTEFIEPEPVNYAPIIKNRLPKQPVTAGKPFSYTVPLETFFDNEDGANLKLSLLDKNNEPLKPNSWIQFNPKTREIYGLPLEDAVSKWQFLLRATDSANESVTETVDISVQQHKAHRSANNEISIGIQLNEKFASNVDWQIKLIRGIVEVLGDTSMSSVVVREIRYGISDTNAATFVYTNESLPKDKCPEEKLDELFQVLTVEKLNESVKSDISVKYVNGKPIGPCLKVELPKPKVVKPTPHTTKNYPPVPRNQVDRVNASVNQLLVFKVPVDTFYDPEDNTDLKLSLLSNDRTPLDPKHWLQFDAKNQEFYGIPTYADAGQKEYLLVAEDREGLQATDALVVVVSHPQHREYNNLFEMILGMQYDDFNNSAVQRRFVERIASVFGDSTTSNIQIRAFRKIHQSGKTIVNYYNTTLHRPHHVCPTDTIENLKRILVHPDGSVRHRIKDAIGHEFELQKISFSPAGACVDVEKIVHHAGIPIKPDDGESSTFKDDYLLTFVLPAVIIVAMLLLAAIIACVLHRRRMTGKMELGDEEERRSFRSKGIPVIFQDELDEKPEIGNKSPIILKDEKPPLLPPSYNSTNPDDHEDMDEYVPPPAVVLINGRETRGKSPVTPSYRKPPPYVSP